MENLDFNVRNKNLNNDIFEMKKCEQCTGCTKKIKKRMKILNMNMLNPNLYLNMEKKTII